jgi:predicted dehydrogenase
VTPWSLAGSVNRHGHTVGPDGRAATLAPTVGTTPGGTTRRGVGVGIVGAGSVFWAYLQTLDRLIPRGLAWQGPVCARDRSTWPGLLAKRPSLQLVETPDEVFRADVDVVVIATSPSSHAPLTIEALRHGKHVVAEKPLALHIAEAEAIFDEAASRALHVMAAPFTHLSPTIREIWTRITDGAIGRVHLARAQYGNIGAPWAEWFRAGEVGPLAEAGIYNLKTLTAILGPAVEVTAVENDQPPGAAGAHPGGESIAVVLRHGSGAISVITSSHAMLRYRHPAIELYGTEGTANLLGDDWDPRGIELWRQDADGWLTIDPRDPTWLWTDGLREVVAALLDGRPPLTDPAHDLHLLDVIEAAETAARERRAVPVRERPMAMDLRIDLSGAEAHVHDHTRPPDEQ